MNKLLLILAAAVLLSACSTPQQTDLKTALLQKLKDDSDLKDYKIDPAEIADCVVGEITAEIPAYAGDPRRERFFQAYTKFVSINSAEEAEKALAEFEELFGSKKAAREAAANIANHNMTCMGKAIDHSDGQRQ
ncbi:MAG: hypothetical protein ACR2HF_05190 [Methylococcaceae bacterium]